MSPSVIIYAPTVSLYVLATMLFAMQFFNAVSNTGNPQTLPPKVQALSYWTLGLACFGHFLLLADTAAQFNRYRLSITHVAAVMAFLVTLTMLVANRFIKNLIFLPVVSAVAALLLTLYVFVPASTHIDSDMNFGLVAHIVLSLLSFCVLSISALYSTQLAYINYQLKHKKRSMIAAKLPPLMSVEHALYRLMYIGSIMLAIALATGFIFIPNMFADGYAHKTLLSSIAFAVYILSLIIHHFYGLRVRIVVILNLIGLSLLTLAYFGSRLVQEFIL